MMTKEDLKRYRDAEAKEIEDCKNRLANRHGLPRNEKFEKAWRIAWDEGHSCGLEEVERYFDDLAELLKP